jgi:hypothetical protein
MFKDLEPDGPLTPQQEALVQALSAADIAKIDAMLLSYTLPRWRKVSMIVSSAMFAFVDHYADPFRGIPDAYLAQRVMALVQRGELQALGDLSRMRYSEVRVRTE